MNVDKPDAVELVDELSKDDRWAIGQALEVLFFAGKTEKQCKAINNLLDLSDRQTFKLHKLSAENDRLKKEVEAANQWTYLPELPTMDGAFWVTAKDGTVHLGYMKPDMSGFRRKGVVAWMPYPEQPRPAEIKPSEDEV